MSTETFLPAVNLNQIEPSPTNPRKHFDKDKLAELADSIRQHGVIQAVVLRKHPDPKKFYELVAGERRWRAARIAKLEAIPAIVRELTDKDVVEIQSIENLQRDDIHPLDEAVGYWKLVKSFGYTSDVIAKK